MPSSSFSPDGTMVMIIAWEGRRPASGARPLKLDPTSAVTVYSLADGKIVWRTAADAVDNGLIGFRARWMDGHSVLVWSEDHAVEERIDLDGGRPRMTDLDLTVDPDAVSNDGTAALGLKGDTVAPGEQRVFPVTIR
jgi:hypothetical protein